MDGHIGLELLEFGGVLTQVTRTIQTRGHPHPQTRVTEVIGDVDMELGRPLLIGFLVDIEADVAGFRLTRAILNLPVCQTGGLQKAVETLLEGLDGGFDLIESIFLLRFQLSDECLTLIGGKHLLLVDIDVTLGVPPLDDMLATTQGSLKGILVPLVHIRQVQVTELTGSAVRLLTEGGLIPVIGGLEVSAEVIEEDDDVCLFHGVMSFNLFPLLFLLRRYKKKTNLPNFFALF